MGAEEGKKAGQGDYTNQNKAGTKEAYDYLSGDSYNTLMGYTPKSVVADQITASRANRGDIRDVSVDTRAADASANYAMQRAYGNRYNVGAGMGDFVGNSGVLQQIAMGNYSPLTQGLNEQARRQAVSGMNTAASQFSSKGALNSGAARAALAEAAMTPFANVQNLLGMKKADLSGGLMNQNIGLSYNDRQFGNQSGFRAAELGLQGVDRLLAGNQLGLQAGISNQGMDWNAANLNANLEQQAVLANQAANLKAEMANQNAGLSAYGTRAGLYGTNANAYTSLGAPALTYNMTQGDRGQATLASVGSVVGGVGSAIGGIASGTGSLLTGIADKKGK